LGGGALPLKRLTGESGRRPGQASWPPSASAAAIEQPRLAACSAKLAGAAWLGREGGGVAWAGRRGCLPARGSSCLAAAVAAGTLGHSRRGPPVRPARATHGWRSEQRRGGGAGTAAGERHIAHRARARKRGQQRMRARAAGRAAMATSHGHAAVRLDAARGSARPWQGTRRAHNAPSAQLCARATARAAGVAAGTRGARARGRVSGWDTPACARGRARGCARARGRAATGRAARPCERQGSPALAAQSRSTELRGL